MTAPQIPVKCSVDTCHYWEQNYCTADALEVNSMFDSEAETSDDTCCTTFRPGEQA